MDIHDLGNGVRTVASAASVDDVLDKLENLAISHGMKIFARIDFSKDAAAVGMKLRPTQLLILGNPTGGTPLMVAAPSVALDLPLKVLAWQDESGQCWVSFNAPEYLQQRHGFPAAMIVKIAGLAALVDTAVQSP